MVNKPEGMISSTFATFMDSLFGDVYTDDESYKEFKTCFFTGFHLCFELFTETLANKDPQRKTIQIKMLRDEMEEFFESIMGTFDPPRKKPVGDKIPITKEQAISLLPKDKEYIHTFVSNFSDTLVGMEWTREELLEEIKKHPCEIGGEQCCAMGHGLVINDGEIPMFVEVDKGLLSKLEKELNGTH